MADKFIEISVEGEDKTILALERMQRENERLARDLIEDLSEAGAVWLISFVPQYNGYILRHIDRAGPTWMPGGPGGGGEWKAIVGIKEGSSRHPLYAEFGTGLYAGRGLIFASGVKGLTGRNQSVMRFEKRGEGGGKGLYRYWIKGQRGQHYFNLTWRVLQAHAATRVSRARLF